MTIPGFGNDAIVIYSSHQCERWRYWYNSAKKTTSSPLVVVFNLKKNGENLLLPIDYFKLYLLSK